MTTYANTQNNSFLETSEILRTSGFRQFRKLLKVNNKNLVDYPNGKFTTEDIIQECKENFWFFLREIVGSIGNEPRKKFVMKSGIFINFEAMINGNRVLMLNPNDYDKYEVVIFAMWKVLRGEKPNVMVLSDVDFGDFIKLQSEITLLREDIKLPLIIPVYEEYQLEEGEPVIIFADKLTNRALSLYFRLNESRRTGLYSKYDHGFFDHDIIEVIEKKYIGIQEVDYSDFHKGAMSGKLFECRPKTL